MRKKLGELLVDQGLINESQLEQALALQRRNGMRLGAALVSCGHIAESQLVRSLGELLQVETIDLNGHTPDVEALKLLSARFAAENDIFPLRLRRARGRRVLTVAMVDPLDVRTVDEMSFMTNAHIEAVLASASDVDRAIRQAYGPRLAGKAPSHPLPLDMDGGSGTMTILRRGGGEERIQTSTRQAVPSAPQTSDLPVVNALPEGPGPFLLTDEVGRTPPAMRAPAVPPMREPLRGPSPQPDRRAPPPLPHRPPPGPGPGGRPASSDLPGGGANSDLGPALGALVDGSGQTVDAAAVLRLEKRFWAMLRVLSRKGLITKEEFMRELGDDQSWT